MMSKKDTANQVPPRDGLDNTGTQGYDSLTDDAFTGSSEKPLEHPNDHESGTGSSSEDFPDTKEEKSNASE